MGSRALFGRYLPAASPVHRLDPRTKLIGVLVFVVLLFAANSPLGLAILAIAELALFSLAKIPPLEALRSVIPLLFIIVLTSLFNLLFVQGGTIYVDWGWLQISQQGVLTAAYIAVRLLLLLLTGSLLTLTTTSLSITDATEKLLWPLRRIGVPAHEFAFVMGVALKFVPQFALELSSIRTAQVARGARFSTSPIRHGISALSSLLVPLFASVLRHADTLSAAMDARCYHGAYGRTSLHPLRFEKRDALAALFLLILTALVIASRFI